MIQAGQQSTFPKLLFLANRMKIERLIEEGLLLGKEGKKTQEGATLRDDESLHLHGQELRNDVDSSSAEELPLLRHESRRSSSMMQELKRQSGVFFDDVEAEGDETDTSAVDDDDGHHLELVKQPVTMG